MQLERSPVPLLAERRERRAHLLLAELREREEDAYRASFRAAGRIRTGALGVALRWVVAHTSETMDDLAAMALRRHLRLGSFASLALDTMRRAADVLSDRLLDEEGAYRRAVSLSNEGLPVARLLRAAAIDDGDQALAGWCARWVPVRRRVIDQLRREAASHARRRHAPGPRPSREWR